MAKRLPSSSDSPLEAALAYARRGWGVFPLSGKHPFPGSHGHRDATTSPSQIRRWWKEHPTANVGIACNSITGPIVVDVDGPEGERAVRQLSLPETREATSGRPHRRHLYFAPPESGVTIKRKLHVRQQLDILGDGGYVVAPPSIHPKTGKPYRWVKKLKMKPLPETLVTLMQGGTEKSAKRLVAPPLPDVLSEGKRDDLLTSLAGSMRRRGASEGAILAALREENASRCSPPLPDTQLQKIARSIAKHAPAAKAENLTDLGNARRFVSMFHQDLRYVKTWRRPWLIWDGRRWASDDTGEAERRAKQAVLSIASEAVMIEDETARKAVLKHALNSEQASRINGLLQLASTEPELVCTSDSLDSNPMTFNLRNGTLDLRNGKVRPHRREDLLTKLSGVSHDRRAAAPLWSRFLREITNGDRELEGFLQRAAGYSLSGETTEQCLFFCYGRGANGKTTFLEVMRALFGDYAQQADFNTFLARNSEGPRNDLARMRGARLITAVEAHGEKPFDETVLKQLTGSDTIVARKLYEEFAEFRPTHKLWLAANHRPTVKDHTHAFWRRIKLIPFMVTIPVSRRDPELVHRIVKKELPGVLNWAVTGLHQWSKNGLQEPSIVQAATQSYREESDIIGDFMAKRCQLRPEGWTANAELYRVFTEWYIEAHGARTRVPSPVWIGRLLSEREEITQRKLRGVRGWGGIIVKEE